MKAVDFLTNLFAAPPKGTAEQGAVSPDAFDALLAEATDQQALLLKSGSSDRDAAADLLRGAAPDPQLAAALLPHAEDAQPAPRMRVGAQPRAAVDPRALPLAPQLVLPEATAGAAGPHEVARAAEALAASPVKNADETSPDEALANTALLGQVAAQLARLVAPAQPPAAAATPAPAEAVEHAPSAGARTGTPDATLAAHPAAGSPFTRHDAYVQSGEYLRTMQDVVSGLEPLVADASARAPAAGAHVAGAPALPSLPEHAAARAAPARGPGALTLADGMVAPPVPDASAAPQAALRTPVAHAAPAAVASGPDLPGALAAAGRTPGAAAPQQQLASAQPATVAPQQTMPGLPQARDARLPQPASAALPQAQPAATSAPDAARAAASARPLAAPGVAATHAAATHAPVQVQVQVQAPVQAQVQAAPAAPMAAAAPQPAPLAADGAQPPQPAQTPTPTQNAPSAAGVVTPMPAAPAAPAQAFSRAPTTEPAPTTASVLGQASQPRSPLPNAPPLAVGAPGAPAAPPAPQPTDARVAVAQQPTSARGEPVSDRSADRVQTGLAGSPASLQTPVAPAAAQLGAQPTRVDVVSAGRRAVKGQLRDVDAAQLGTFAAAPAPIAPLATPPVAPAPAPLAAQRSATQPAPARDLPAFAPAALGMPAAPREGTVRTQELVPSELRGAPVAARRALDGASTFVPTSPAVVDRVAAPLSAEQARPAEAMLATQAGAEPRERPVAHVPTQVLPPLPPPAPLAPPAAAQALEGSMIEAAQQQLIESESTANARGERASKGGEDPLERLSAFTRGAAVGSTLSAYGGRGHAGAEHRGSRDERSEEREDRGVTSGQHQALEATARAFEQASVQLQQPPAEPQPSTPAQRPPVPMTSPVPLPELPDLELARAPVQPENASISLHHPDLGPIQLQVHRNQGRVEVHALIESAHAEAVLRANESGIRYGVQQSGMALGALRVRMRDGDERELPTTRSAAIAKKRRVTSERQA